MSTVFNCTASDINRQRLHYSSEVVSHSAASSQSKHRHRELFLAELKVLGGAHFGGTIVRKTAAHASRFRITIDVALPIGDRHPFRMDRLMVKEPVEQFTFAAFRQKLGKIGKGIERKLPKLDIRFER